MRHEYIQSQSAGYAPSMTVTIVPKPAGQKIKFGASFGNNKHTKEKKNSRTFKHTNLNPHVWTPSG